LTDSSGNPILDGSGQYLTSAGDTTFIPTALTDESWDALSLGDQQALYNSIYGDDLGIDFAPGEVPGGLFDSGISDGFASGIDDGFDFDSDFYWL
jgi:hypothetical protein